MKRKTPSNPMIPIQNAQLLAIEGRLTNSLDSFERRVRRWFSKEHSTPYLDTFKLPWDELLLHYYESNLTTKSYNEVFDMAVEQYLPEFMEQAEEDDQEFANKLIKQQETALKAQEAIKKKNRDLEKASKELINSEAIIKDKAQSVEKMISEKNQSDKPTPKTMSLKFEEEPGDS
jgi:primosomal protein N'